MIDFAYAADAAQPNMIKKFKTHQAMLKELKRGDRVILASGFAGTITAVNEQFFSVEIAKGVVVEVERNAIASKQAA